MRQGNNTALPCFAQNRPNQSRLWALKRGYLRSFKSANNRYTESGKSMETDFYKQDKDRNSYGRFTSHGNAERTKI